MVPSSLGLDAGTNTGGGLNTLFSGLIPGREAGVIIDLDAMIGDCISFRIIWVEEIWDMDGGSLADTDER
jgi:hypothetical protein